VNTKQAHSHEVHKNKFYTVLSDELACHVPYGIFAVALGLTILSVISALVTVGKVDTIFVKKLAKVLFHNFHFMHIVFAATGTILTYRKFTNQVLRSLIIGIVSPLIFCMLSDVVLPYAGARLLGVNAKMHICFIEEPTRILPFLFIGVLNGFLMARHGQETRWFYSIGSHATHIFISSLASVFYLISQGFAEVHIQIGNIFLLLIVAVIVPCTFSDVIVPMFLAQGGVTHHAEH
jgi:hypothetical protein